MLGPLKAAFGLYTKKGAFGAIQTLKNKSTFSEVCEEYGDYYYYDDQNVDSASMYMLTITLLLIMVSISFVLGFVAVNHICNDQTPRCKNTRLGLYFLLILTGGAVGWIYILMWILKIDLC